MYGTRTREAVRHQLSLSYEGLQATSSQRHSALSQQRNKKVYTVSHTYPVPRIHPHTRSTHTHTHTNNCVATIALATNRVGYPSLCSHHQRNLVSIGDRVHNSAKPPTKQRCVFCVFDRGWAGEESAPMPCQSRTTSYSPGIQRGSMGHEHSPPNPIVDSSSNSAMLVAKKMKRENTNCCLPLSLPISDSDWTHQEARFDSQSGFVPTNQRIASSYPTF
jgi:hypothetical protein